MVTMFVIDQTLPYQKFVEIMFRRAATELLSLDKDDVQSVLLASVHGKNEDVFKCLSLFPYFSGWSEKSIKECCILSSIKRFLQNTVILDCADKTHSYTYFIIDGFCEVVQRFVLRLKNESSGRKVFGIHPDQNTEDNDSITVFVKIGAFGPGECFGLGEDLTNRWIISSTPIRCLVIPRDFLLQHNENNVWPRARQRISASFPNAKQIYQSIRQQVKWDRFKKQYSEYLLVNRNYTIGTRLQDVPRYWRLNIDVPKALL